MKRNSQQSTPDQSYTSPKGKMSVGPAMNPVADSLFQLMKEGNSLKASENQNPQIRERKRATTELAPV